MRTATMAIALMGVLGAASAASSQEATAVPERTPPAIENPPSPGGAMLRAILLPGWGHASIGAHTRGGFYFAAEVGAASMFLRSRWRRGEAQERVALRERVLRSALEAEGISDPTEIDERLGDDPALAGARRLVDARGGQQEDWLALGIFLMLLSGADAFVSAHLGNFPEPIAPEVTYLGSGAMEVHLRVFLPW